MYQAELQNVREQTNLIILIDRLIVILFRKNYKGKNAHFSRAKAINTKQ